MRTQRIGQEPTTWVKSRELVDTTFGIRDINRGEGNFGPQIYLHLKDGRTLSVPTASIIAKQLEKVGFESVTAGDRTFTIAKSFSQTRGKDVYTIREVLPDTEGA